jgi:exopolysaccharide biosynthesis protein
LLQLAGRGDPVAVINGGYFHPQTYWPAGDLVVDGKQIAKGRIRTAIAITSDKEVRILTRSKIRPVVWKGYDTLIASGPHIVQKGQVVIEPRAEGYRDASIWQRARRSAVGLVDHQYLILVSTSRELTLNELGKIMVRLGAKEAIALDGGSSAGLVWQDRVLVRPARAISYGIGVFIVQ